MTTAPSYLNFIIRENIWILDFSGFTVPVRSVLSFWRNNVIFPQESGRAELSPEGSWGQGATGELEGSTRLLATHPLQGCKVGPGRWGKAPARAKGESWVGRAGMVNPTSQGTENVGQVLYSSAWKRSEQRHKWKRSVESWGAQMKLPVFSTTKFRRHQKKLAALSWIVFPVLSGQHSLISRNLVLNASPFQVFRGLEYVALKRMYQRQH